MQENIYQLIEILGTIAFSMSGAFAAMQKRFDIVGVIIIAFVTSVGGGTLRDVLLNNPVFWMYDLTTCTLILMSAMIAIAVKSIEKTYRVTLFMFDSFGLGLFTIIGIQKGMSAELHGAICVLLGAITGCFGGVLRDILLNRIPLIFRKEIYATACIVGGILYYVLTKFTNLSPTFIQISTILLIVAIRTLSVKFHWRFPPIDSYKDY